MEKRPDNQQGPKDEAGIVAACRELHASIDALDERAAKVLGVSRNDLRCLNLLERGPGSPTRIADALGLTKGSVSVLLDRLEKKDLVRRMPDPEDGRAFYVEATSKAWLSLAEIYRPFGEALVNLSSAYGRQHASAAAAALLDIAKLCRAEASKA
jgi:DNA-binding MarR family transcriptional regulator